MLKKYGQVSKRPVLKITHNDAINYHTLYVTIRKIIDKSDYTAPAKFILKTTCSAVLKRNKTIGEILINSGPASSEFDWRKEPKCTCNTTPHTLMRLEEFNDPLVKKVASVSAKFVPASDFSSFVFIHEICDYLENIGPFPTDQNYINMTHVDNVKERLEFLLKLLCIPHEHRSRLTDELHACAHETQPYFVIQDITKKDVVAVRKKLKGLIITPIDKNIGKLLIECPVMHHRRIKANLYDHPNFILWGQTQLQIFKSMKTMFENKGLNRIASWNTKHMTLPKAKVIGKDKDVQNKSRLIASYFKHPLRRLFKLVSKALTWLFRKLPKTIKHFTLHRLDDLTRKIQGVKKKFSKHKNCGILPFQTDVTCMFTNLDQGQIRNAVMWLLDLSTKFCPRRTQKTVVRISRTAPYDVAWGKGYEEENHIAITFAQIIDAVDLDLNFAFCSIGRDIFKQRQGCPIGGCLSSIYANVKCAFDEHMFNFTNKTFSSRVFAIRQMDDMLVWVAFDKEDEKSRELAEYFKKAILTTGCLYKGGLVLEEQPLLAKGKRFTHKFAGTLIYGYEDDTTTFSVSRNKNWEALKETGKQKILTFPHVDSKLSNRVKTGVQIGTMARIMSQCTRVDSAIPCFIQNLIEMESLGYPKEFLFRCLNRVRKRNLAMECTVKLVKLAIRTFQDSKHRIRSKALIDWVEKQIDESVKL